MRKTIAAVAAAATGLTVLAGPGAAAAGEAAGQAAGVQTRIDWQRCANENLRVGGLTCGFVRVPLDYARPNGKQISIAVSRAKADSNRRGVMLGNYGGPGVQGLDAGVMHIAPGASDYDLIGFDPRGMGASRPLLRCTYPTFEAPAADPRPTGKAGSAIGAEEKRWLAHSKKAARACAGSGPILEHVTTREIAQDMDRIRRALGVSKISYLGLSYGTYLGQVYATLFPSRVDKMVLDSVVDPRGIWYEMQEWQDVALDRALRRFWAWVARHDDLYHLGSTAARVAARYEAARARLAARPDGKVGPKEFEDVFLDAGSEAAWADTAAAFAAWEDGRKGPLTEIGDLLNYGGVLHGSYLAVVCTDAAWPAKYATWRRDGFRIAEVSPLSGWSNIWYKAACLSWPAPAGTPVEVDGSKALALLILNSQYDSATPLRGALEARRRFPGAALVQLGGVGRHIVVRDAPACLGNAVRAYLTQNEIPERKAGRVADLTCKALPAPEEPARIPPG